MEHTGTRLDNCRICLDVYSGCTACLRSPFGGALNVNVADTHADAVPHSCVPFVICRYTPFISIEVVHSEQPLVTEIAASACLHT